MTIDETIAQEREKAKEQRYYANFEKNGLMYQSCVKRAEYHEQIAKWLEELKDYQDKNKMVVRVDVENMDSIKDKIEELSKYAERQYDKAIDDLLGGINQITYNCQDADELFEKICDLAEQLKVGGKNEIN